MSKVFNTLTKNGFIEMFNKGKLSEENIKNLYFELFTENEWNGEFFINYHDKKDCIFFSNVLPSNIMEISCELGYVDFIDKLLCSMKNEVYREESICDLLSNFFGRIEDLKSTTIKIIKENIKPENIYLYLKSLLNLSCSKKRSFISFFIHEIFIIDKLKIIDYLDNVDNNNNSFDIKLNQLEIDYEKKITSFFLLIYEELIDDNIFYVLKNIIYKEDLLYIKIKDEKTFLEYFVFCNFFFGLKVIKLYCEDINKKRFDKENTLIQCIVSKLSSDYCHNDSFKNTQEDFLNIISYLAIEKKVDLLNENNEGLNAFEMAIKGEVFEIAFELLKINNKVIIGKDIKKILINCYDHNRFELINYIFKNDLFDIKDFFKVKTFDFFFITNPRIRYHDRHNYNLDKKVSFFRLINSDIDFNDFQDEKGQNILHSVSKFNNIKFMKFFVKETNIDLNKKNNGGYTPLMIVLRRKSHISEQCIELFLNQKRFDPYITDKYNKSYLKTIKQNTRRKSFKKSLLKRTFEKFNQNDENNNNENDYLLPINKKQKLN